MFIWLFTCFVYFNVIFHLIIFIFIWLFMIHLFSRVIFFPILFTWCQMYLPEFTWAISGHKQVKFIVHTWSHITHIIINIHWSCEIFFSRLLDQHHPPTWRHFSHTALHLTPFQVSITAWHDPPPKLSVISSECHILIQLLDSFLS